MFGQPVSRGVAIGRAVLVASSRVDVAHYFIDPAHASAEVARLRHARDTVVQEITALKADLPPEAPPELAALLDVHLMLLNDPMLTEATRHWIEARHYNAEWAMTAQTEVLVRQFDEMDDEYLRERKADIEQVAERVLRALAKEESLLPQVGQARDLDSGDPLVLVANDIAPADMLQFKGSVFKGFVTDVGGRTSHTAIVARSMDIPAVVGAREASRLVRQDDWLIIDGDAGVVVINPTPIVLEEYRFRQRQSELERARLHRLRHMPSVTLDGQAVELLANIELPGDAVNALEAGAVGVGLFRSEFLFMNRDGELPDEDEQFEAYRAAVLAMAGLPVTIRLLDPPLHEFLPTEESDFADVAEAAGVGIDILKRRAAELHEFNPMMGHRGCRLGISYPEITEMQARAVIEAALNMKARGFEVKAEIMVPLVGTVREFDAQAKVIRQTAAAVFAERGEQLEYLLGTMIETPRAAVIADSIARQAEFFSFGTNDLTQMTLGFSRDDAGKFLPDYLRKGIYEHDPFRSIDQKGVGALVEMAVRKGQQARPGIETGVCGEHGGDPASVEFFHGAGLDYVSCSPFRVPIARLAAAQAAIRE
mgnify:CR=1 FL=1